MQGPVLSERVIGNVTFRLGPIPPIGHGLVVLLLADSPESEKLAQKVFGSLDVDLDRNFPSNSDGTIIATIFAQNPSVQVVQSPAATLVVLPISVVGKSLHGSIANSLRDFFNGTQAASVINDMASSPPSLWIAPFATGLGTGDPIGILDAVVTAFLPENVQATYPPGFSVSISVPEQDEKTGYALAQRIDELSLIIPTGFATEKDARQSDNVGQSSSPDMSSESSDAIMDTGTLTSEETETLPPDPAPLHVINDAEFRFDRPVQGMAQDTLDRHVIAQAIAQRVIGVWRAYQDPDRNRHTKNWKPAYPGHPFIVHLAGRWGSGKSSILNFLAEQLRKDESVTLPPPPGRVWGDGPKGWTIIEFNAWRQQESGHAWWALMTALSGQAPAQMGARGWRFRMRDRVWRFNSSWRNWIIGGASVVTLLLFWWAIFGKAESGIGETLKTIGGVITAIVGIVAFTSTFAARSKRTAEAIQNLNIDPTAALKNRFEDMIREIHNPVAIFIDDLDRCEASYVVELLQAMQTVYADVPVLYVVAADRNWLVSAYDQTYAKFTAAISEKGQPLGYLFVKKIFQLSVNVPDLSDSDQRQFLKSLLPNTAIDQPTQEVLDQIASSVSGTATLKELTEVVAKQPSEATKRAAGRAALSKLMTETTTQQVTHLLVNTLAPDGSPPLMDANPRAITRLVNAYSFRFGYALGAGDFDVIDKLPYWCVLDLRYPAAARRLAEKPALRRDNAWRAKAEAAHFPDPDEIARIIAPLTPDDIETLRGFG